MTIRYSCVFVSQLIIYPLRCGLGRFQASEIGAPFVTVDHTQYSKTDVAYVVRLYPHWKTKANTLMVLSDK